MGLRGVLGAERGWLAAAAAVDLLVGAPAGVVVPVVSLLGGWSGVALLSTLSTWAVTAVAVYVFTPLVYPSRVLPRHAPGFRAVAAGGTVLLGVGAAWSQGERLLAGVGLSLVGWSLTAVVLLWYLRHVHGWTLVHPWSRAVSVVEWVGPRETAAEFAAGALAPDAEPGRRRAVARTLWLVAVGLLVAFPVVLCGGLSTLLIRAFPFPDLLLLTWVAASSVLARTDRGPGPEWVESVRFEIDRFLHGAVENATRGWQGLCSTILVLVGLIPPVGLLSATPSLALRLVEVASLLPAAAGDVRALGVAALGTWVILGLLALVLSTALLGLWAWIREFRRLPRFLDQWEGTPRTGAPARVPGVAVLPSLALLAGGVSLVPLLSGPGTVAAMAPLALLWPVLVGLQAWTVRYTRRRTATPLRHENYWIAAAATVQFLVLWGVGSLAPDVSVWAFAPQIGVMTLLFAVLATYPSVHRAETVAGRSPRYTVAYALVLGGVLLAASLPLDGANATAVAGVGVLVGVPALLWVLRLVVPGVGDTTG